MSAFLKHKFFKAYITSLAICFLSVNLFAQCNLITSAKANAIAIETPARYQYIRIANKLYGVTVKTVLLKKVAGNFFHIEVSYIGSSYVNEAMTLSFKFENAGAVTGRLKLLKNRKIDNVKLKSGDYMMQLNDKDLTDLKQNNLKEIIISKKSGSVTIPVNDPVIMQAQITCLQTEL